EDAFAAEELDCLEEVTPRTDRRVDVESVSPAGVEVVGAVTGRRVDRAGAGVQRDVLTEHTERWPRVERMLETNVLQLLALHAGDRRVKSLTRDGGDFGPKRFGDDDGPAGHLIR